MGMGLVERIAGQLARPDHAFQRRVLEAAGRDEVVRWPSAGGHAPPPVDVWQWDRGSYSHVGRSVLALQRDELLRLLDTPAGGDRQLWAVTSLGRAVLAALAALAGPPGQGEQGEQGEQGGVQ